MRVAIVALAAVVVACGGCVPEAAGGEGEGEGTCAEILGLPPPSDPCIPVCGNDLGVGAPCTRSGGECNQFVGSGAAFCTVDQDDTELAFCTKPCAADADCGGDAVCTGDPEDPGGPKGCVPAACASEGEGEGEGES